MIELVSKAEFEAAYRKYMEEGGHSYDAWDLAYSWSKYQLDPSKYDWLEFPYYEQTH